MTELDLVELRESAEEPYAFDFDGHEDLILALIDRLEAAEGERDRLREALGRALLLLDAVVEEAGDPLGRVIAASIKALGIRDSLVPGEEQT